MLSVQDVKDIAYLHFLDTSEIHQNWVNRTFKHQPGDEVMAPNPYYFNGTGIGDRLTNAIVLDYERGGNYEHYVKVRTNPGTMRETFLRVHVKRIKDLTHETHDKMFYAKRIHDIAQKAYYEGTPATFKDIIEQEISKSPFSMREDLEVFFHIFEYTGLHVAWRLVENRID